jgi:hypothetical protein
VRAARSWALVRGRVRVWGGVWGRGHAGAIVAAVAAIASAGALTACGPSASSGSSASSASGGTSAGTSAVSLATSLSTVKESWAVVPVSANPAFWEVLVRPAKSATWRLVTPPGVADNSGLVAATTASSLTVAVRPSQDLLFSPLASTTDAGSTWSTTGPLSAGVAASPGALAASGSQLLAVLDDGAIAASSDGGVSWRTIAKPGAIAASPAGKTCGTVTISSVSFGITGGEALAAGSCGTAGTTAIFSRSLLSPAGEWQRVGLPVSGPLLRLFAAGTALVRAKTGLTTLRGGAGGWTASAPLPVTGKVIASGELAEPASAAADGTWVLLPGGQAATIGGQGKQWLQLPPTPAATSMLASGPDGAVDALAVSGATLTIWRLVPAATVWTKIQTIAVPIQYGSSS